MYYLTEIVILFSLFNSRTITNHCSTQYIFRRTIFRALFILKDLDQRVPSVQHTRQFNTKWPLLFNPKNSSVQHKKGVPLSQTYTPSVQHKGHSFSDSEIRQLDTSNASIQHKKASVQHTRQFNTKKISVQHTHQFNTKSVS